MFSDENVALVHKLAYLIWRRYPSSEIEDLIQSGFVGLLKAEKRFDPKLGVPFAKYATTRILGEIRDGVRRGNYGIRRLAKIKRDIREATKRIENRENRPATSKDLAAEIRDYHLISQELMALNKTELTEDIPCTNNPEEEAHIERETIKIRERFKRLTAREEKALRLYYIEDKYLHEVGAQLGGLTESRACQIVQGARKKLWIVNSE